jgi:hypothetical protein
VGWKIVHDTDVLSALVAMRGPSDVKSVPDPAGKQLELPGPLLEPLLDPLLDPLGDPLEPVLLEELPLPFPLDAPLDDPPAPGPPPALVELDVDGRPELLPLPPPDEFDSPAPLEPAPIDAALPPGPPSVLVPTSLPPLAQWAPATETTKNNPARRRMDMEVLPEGADAAPTIRPSGAP